jgi:UDP-N-acetylglucosamine 2-epimerase (non-hydrolysing)
MSKKIMFLVGTRPEFIKVAPIMRLLQKENTPYVFVHSNQHYSEEMDKKIIQDLSLRVQDYNLDIKSGPHGEQTGKIMERFEKVCLEVNPSMVLVHGDTNTTLAGALVAAKLHIPVGHIEAGLRSFDMNMPEEINRVLVDRISDLLFAPTGLAKENLLKDGVAENKIVVTGNTVVDALYQHSDISEKSKVLEENKIEKDGYIVVTAHRPENVDSKDRLEKLFTLLEHASNKLHKKIIFPIHPRTRKNLGAFSVKIPEQITLINPVGYIDMLSLLKNATLIMTDSGGIQEEAYILKKPAVTLRDSTERPETLTANFIVDNSIEKFDQAWSSFESGNVYWEDRFGKGDASALIVEHVKNYITFKYDK